MKYKALIVTQVRSAEKKVISASSTLVEGSFKDMHKYVSQMTDTCVDNKLQQLGEEDWNTVMFIVPLNFTWEQLNWMSNCYPKDFCYLLPDDQDITGGWKYKVMRWMRRRIFKSYYSKVDRL